MVLNVRRHFSKYGVRWLCALLLTVLAAAQSLEFLPPTLVNRIDLFFYDMRLQVEQPQLDTRIVIVDIDQKSLAEVGRWPWSRDVVAELVNKLAGHYEARTIAFDVMFNEPDTSSGYATLVGLADKELMNVPGISKQLEALKPVLDYDGRFARAIEGRPVVLSYFMSNQAPKGLPPPPAFTVDDLGGRQLDALSWKAYDANLPQLQRVARAGGYMNTEVDADGLLRSVPLLGQVGTGYYESLSLATARVALGATAVRPVFFDADEALMSEEQLRQYGALKAIDLDSKPRVRIPVEPNIKALVQFRGKGGPDGGAFRYVSASDVLKGALPKHELFDRIILVGTTAPGLNDLRATPVNKEYPGVEQHANIIASILDGEFKQRPDFSPAFDLLQIIGVGIVLGLVLPVLTPVTSILFAVASAASLGAFNLWMYQSLHWVMPMATALLLVAGLFVFNIAWGYLFEYRKGRAIVNLFGEYVAPELVAEMAANPQSYSMEGESRELTVLFADVRGFTTISEGLDPNSLREYINRYLTAMSEDIRSNRGTLDKYIGDAVMAFWGAPVALPDHASRAVGTALQMQATAGNLNKDFIARGWPPLKIGIGLNTGEMRVGDMGSKIRRAYTVMGDAVNLSSRLEGITKVYGVGIAVGEGTKLAAPTYAYRELDRVRVKGKNEPVPIYEPLGLASELGADTRAELVQWHAALGMVRAQQWEQAEQLLHQLQQAHPEDKLYALYLQRIAHYREHPPGAGWDGVTTFDSK
ncbi:CHASE2 domain-containing protein [Noviherbaspirillum agri]